MSTMTLTTPATPAPEAEDEQPSGGRRKLLVVLVLVLALAGAGWWFLLRPSGPEKPEPGAVVQLDAIQVNLADDHYLRIGIALQASKDAGTEVEGSKALDATIELFSGRTKEELAQGKVRDRLKEQLTHTLEEAYEGEVIGVYLTDFVTQ